VSDPRFDGKVVVITGASAGIGLAVARRFVAAGAQVVLAARGAERLKAAAAEFGDAAHDVPCDIGDFDQCRALLAAAVDRYGGVDILVNNAGLHHRGPVLSVEAEQLAAMVDINLKTPVFLTRICLPLLKSRGGGAVVQVASLAGCVPAPNSAAYSAAKFGVRTFSRALNEELRGTGIHIGVVSPGPVDTGFIMDDLDGVADLNFSQPISTADAVAAAVLEVAAGPRFEMKLPAMSGYLTTLGYVFPRLARALRPMLERKGRRTKARLRAERGSP
jgi:short-subunit dehydrogenase